MASLEQLTSNRANALKSHGPVTEAGKAAVRLNALKHGFRARQIVLPGESQEDFDQLCQDLESEWQPQTPTERMCLEDMATNRWKLIRAEKVEVMLQDLPADDPLSNQLDSVLLFQGRFERAFQRALRELQRLQKDRRLREKEAAAEKAATAQSDAAAHPPVPPLFRDTKDENGEYLRVVDTPCKLWNKIERCYQVAYDPNLKYPEKLRPLFPTFVRELEKPAPEADAQ
jgi:hypothetical protein